jgi:hypothetical protein
LKRESVIDKVLFHKGRVWTIYAETNNGAFAFQGVKPYHNFQYDSRIHSTNINFTYIQEEDINPNLLEPNEIESHLKLMSAAEEKKLTLKSAIEFFVQLTGHSKNFTSKKIEKTGHDSFLFNPGQLRYEIWKTNGAILLSHNTNGYTNLAYFDFITFESHTALNEMKSNEQKREIIEQFINNEDGILK